jgi:hypothetical protein
MSKSLIGSGLLFSVSLLTSSVAWAQNQPPMTPSEQAAAESARQNGMVEPYCTEVNFRTRTIIVCVEKHNLPRPNGG